MIPRDIEKKLSKSLASNASLQFVFDTMKKHTQAVETALSADFEIYSHLPPSNDGESSDESVYRANPSRVLKNSLRLLAKNPAVINALLFHYIGTPRYHAMPDFFESLLRSWKQDHKQSILSTVYIELCSSDLPSLILRLLEFSESKNRVVIQEIVDSIQLLADDSDILENANRHSSLSVNKFNASIASLHELLLWLKKESMIDSALKKDHLSYRAFRLSALKESVVKKEYKLPGRPSFDLNPACEEGRLSDCVAEGRSCIRSLFSKESTDSLFRVWDCILWKLVTSSSYLPEDYFSFVFSGFELDSGFVYSSLEKTDTLKKVIMQFNQFSLAAFDYLPDIVSFLNQSFSELESKRMIPSTGKERFQAMKKQLAIIMVRLDVLRFFRLKKLGVDSLILPSFLDLESRKLAILPLEEILYGMKFRLGLTKGYGFKMKRAVFRELMQEAISKGMIKGDTMRR